MSKPKPSPAEILRIRASHMARQKQATELLRAASVEDHRVRAELKETQDSRDSE